MDINNGLDSNSGTRNKPFKTFEYSITQTQNNDKLVLADGIYRLTKVMNVNYNLTIIGTSKSKTIVNCPKGSSFLITANNFKINNMTFRNGYNSGYGGVFKIMDIANFYANNVLFENNRAKRGGIIYNEASESELTLTNCVFNKNKAIEFGGAICTSGDNNNITITNCSFANNQLNYTPSSSVSTGSGGAIYSGGSSGNILRVQNSNFTSNTVKTYGGAIYSGNMAELVINNSRFNNNKAYYNKTYQTRGGAVAVGGRSLNATLSNFTNNYAAQGGAISINSGQNLKIHLCQFNRNNAENVSGAVYLRATSIISNSNFTINSAKYRGGALFTQDTFVKININNSIFKGNYINGTGELFGGAFAANAYHGEYVINNTTFINNRAPSGGSIYLTEGSLNYKYTLQHLLIILQLQLVAYCTTLQKEQM